MRRGLMLVSGIIEIVFGIVAVLGPDAVIEAVGGSGDVPLPTLALVSLLGAATFGLGVGALVGRNHLERPADSRPLMGLASIM